MKRTLAVTKRRLIDSEILLNKSATCGKLVKKDAEHNQGKSELQGELVQEDNKGKREAKVLNDEIEQLRHTQDSLEEELEESREEDMNRIGISAALLVLLTPFVSWGAECNGGGTPFGKYQTVTKGILDLTMAGKLNHATSNDIGEQVKIAEALDEKGEHQKSCDVYDAVIAKYGFKTMAESYYEKYPEKRPGSSTRDQVKSQSSGASATSAVAGEAATADGATES